MHSLEYSVVAWDNVFQCRVGAGTLEVKVFLCDYVEYVLIA